MMRPPFFPIVPDQLAGDVRFHGTGEDDFPVGEREGALALGAPRRPDARLPRRATTACRSRTSPITVRAAIPSTPTTTSRTRCSSSATASTCSSTTRSTRRRVRAEAALGPLHGRLRGARRPRGGRAPPGALPPRSRARRRRPRRDRARRRPTTPRASAAPEVTAGYEGLEIELCARAAGIADEPVAQADPGARSRRHPHRARPLRHRRRDHHRDRRRRAGRHGVQLVHVGVARAAARAVLRGEVVVDVAAHPGRAEVGGEHPGRGRRGDLPAVRGEGRRPLRAHRVHDGPHRRAGARRRDRVRRLRDRRRARRRRSPHRGRARCSSSATRPRASRCSSTAAATAASRSRTSTVRGRGSAARGSRSATWMRVVAATIAITASAIASSQPIERRCRGGTRGSRRRGSPPRARPGPGRSAPATRGFGRRCRPRAGSRGAIQRSKTRWSPFACGPPSAPTARSSASAGHEPRDAEDERGEQGHADRALRDPVGPGVDPLDRLVHRRSLSRSRTLVR